MSRRQRRRPDRRGDRRRPRWWLVAAGGIATAAVLALGVAFWGRGAGSGALTADDAVGCSTMEQLAYHVHAHLAIFVEGAPSRVPGNIGIRRDCIAWLHTHDPDGIIHVEAPGPHTYTLGAFFRIWGQPLDATHLLDLTAGGDQKIVAYVNGQPFGGDPDTVPLDPHADIVLEYGPPFVDPPAYRFPPGL